MAKFRPLGWAKIAANIHANRKIRLGGRAAREVFIYVLTQNAARGGIGVIPAEDLNLKFLADILMMPLGEAELGVVNAIDAGLIRRVGEAIEIVGWDEEWARNPASSQERTKKWRASRRHGDVTESDVTIGDVGDVADRRVTQESRVEERRGEGSDPVPKITPDPTAAAQATKPSKADKIPPRCWELADGLRKIVLREDPNVAISKRPWSDAKTGARLQWADDFRYLVEKRGLSPEEIGEVVRWVRDQPPGRYRIVVQSSSALREKWDQIQAARRRGGAPGGAGDAFAAVDSAVARMNAMDEAS